MAPRFGTDAAELHLRLAHGPGMTAVRLECDRAVPGGRSLERDADGDWRLSLPLGEGLDRLEYRFEVTRRHRVEHLLDPENPRLVGGVFGPRSVVETPRYRRPVWADRPGEGRFEPMVVAGSTSDPVPVTVWSPQGASGSVEDEDEAGLLLVHDGPEYAEYAGLTRYVDHAVSTGLLPPLRLALLHPARREDWYSGSPAYLETLTGAVLDRLCERYATRAPVAVMGASLGGLTAVLGGVADTMPGGSGRIGAVVAQSGSFFTSRTDRQERRFASFDRIAAYVEALLAVPPASSPLVVGMTCGVLEENVANNRAMADALTRSGHDVTYREVPDLHSYTAWRDGLDPLLAEVLSAVWGPASSSDLPGSAPDH